MVSSTARLVFTQTMLQSLAGTAKWTTLPDECLVEERYHAGQSPIGLMVQGDLVPATGLQVIIRNVQSSQDRDFLRVGCLGRLHDLSHLAVNQRSQLIQVGLILGPT